MTTPTKKQRELLNFIDGFIKGNGYSPSFREIMRALDYKSVSTVATHVNGLIARGWLVKRDNSARSLEVVGAVSTPAAQPSNQVKEFLQQKIAQLEKDEKTEDAETLRSAMRVLGYDTPELV